MLLVNGVGWSASFTRVLQYWGLVLWEWASYESVCFLVLLGAAGPMLVDVFSMFDDRSFAFSSSLMWVAGFSWVAVVGGGFFLLPLVSINLLLHPYKLLTNSIKGDSPLTGVSYIMPASMVILIGLNFSGMVPIVFSTTSHFIVSGCMGFVFWASVAIAGAVAYPEVLSGRVVYGSVVPGWFAAALLLIELLSIVARPITLVVRITVNIVIGHILLKLLGSKIVLVVWGSGVVSMLLWVAFFVGVFFIEVGIHLIQTYIFITLLSMYASEMRLFVSVLVSQLTSITGLTAN